MARKKTKTSPNLLPPAGTPVTAAEWRRLGDQTRSWLHEVLAELARLRKNSHNSSRPPSLDTPKDKDKTNKKRRRGKKRKPGGQPGHAGRNRPLVPPDQVDEREDHYPSECRRCHHGLSGINPEEDPRHHQIAEIPEIRPTVTDHACHRVICPDCGTMTTASLPKGIPDTCFGPNLRALVVLFSGRYRISRRETVDLCSSVFGLSVSLGTVANILNRSSQALAPPFEEVSRAVKTAKIAYMDETSWRQKGKGIYLWILLTSACVLFRFGRRTKGVAQDMLGEEYAGALVTDRYVAYSWLAGDRHQVCWAHLARDFERLIDRGGSAKRIGKKLRSVHADLFSIWHTYRDGRIGWETMQSRMGEVEIRIGAVLAKGMNCRDAAAKTLCTSLAKIEPSLFVFARIKGVEPTNNNGERGIRPAVQWRKICFGTQSANGSRFVERILTVVATCKIQGRPLLPYLQRVLIAADSGEEIPSILADHEEETPRSLELEASAKKLQRAG